MLNYYFQSQFKKDLKLIEKRRYDMDAIYDVIAMIIWGESLPERYREHQLHGDLEGFTECHALNDLLLMYIPDEDKVTFSRAGTHSDLF
ncbi:addiction module toxin, RelE/StbE family [Spirochaetia bacterium]|nr:addiction module toxin, RelE/StbE family [Spirochaetia bacterium]